MSKIKSLLAAILLGFLQPVGVYAQDITNHSMPIGKGPGVVGWGILGPCATGQVPVWASGATADPTCGFSGSTSGSFTANAVIIGNGSNPFLTAGPGTTGQGLVGSTGNPPVWTGSPSFSGGVTATTGFNSGGPYQLNGSAVLQLSGTYTNILSTDGNENIFLGTQAVDPTIHYRSTTHEWEAQAGTVRATLTTGTTPTFQLGQAGASTGNLALAGATSGNITIAPQAAAGIYNFNLPITAGTAGQVLTSQGGGSAPMTWSTSVAPAAPTVSTVTATAHTGGFGANNSGTYTTPASAVWLDVLLVGGGAGGSGNTLSTAAGATCWNTTGAACTTPVYSAGGGGAASAGGVIGGSSTCNVAAIHGSAGQGGVSTTTGTSSSGGIGGSTVIQGAGVGSAGNAGSAAQADSGSGGGGGGVTVATANTGAGGGSGATCHVIITSPAASYTYQVGAGSNGVAAGGSFQAGGNGASGQIQVIEHYGG